jgi:hypothetical protein
VRRRLDATVGKRRLGRGPLTDLALIRTAFTKGPLSDVTSTDDAWRSTAPVRRAAQPGDLLFFQPAPDVPRVCVVRRKLRGGVIEAACATRGAIRWVRVSTRYPDLRRRQGRVINTFLRKRRREDPARARYLAGQLLWQVRTPFAK